MGGLPGENHRCRQCGGWLKRREVLEHGPCGAIRPRASFEADDELACPECAETPDAEFDRVGTLYSCGSCGEWFDQRWGTATASDPPSSTPVDAYAPRGADGSDRGSTGKIHQFLSAVLVLVLVTGGIGSTVAVSPFLANESEERAWNDYDSIVVFRNDDIQPNYRMESMRAVDELFVREDVPVTQGVIPAVGGDSPPITEAGSVCSYLRERELRHPDLFEFALHGYTHERLTDFHSGSEFGSLPYRQQLERIEEGNRILADCVGHRATTFIPPMDTYDDETVRALDERNFTLVSGGGWFTKEYYNESGVFRRGGLLHVPRSKAFVKNWTTYEFHSQSELRRSFDRAAENGRIYVQMLHYPQFDTAEKRDRLRSLIGYMKSSGDVKFTTLGRLGERFREDTIRRTDSGWQLLEPVDDSSVPYGERVSDGIERAARTIARVADTGGTGD